MKTGCRYALDHEFGMAVQSHGDGQHDPTQIHLLQKHMTGADCIVGSRYLEGEGFQPTTVSRVGIRTISSVFYLSTDRHIRDCISRMRCANCRVIRLFANYYPLDYPELESRAMLLRAGLRVQEAAAIMKARGVGKAPSLAGALFYMSKVIPKVLLSAIFRRCS